MPTQNTHSREYEEQLQLMTEAAKDYAIFLLDPSGRIVTWNAGAERIKGYKAKEIIGQHFEPSRYEVRPDPDDSSFADGGPRAWFVVARRVQ